MRQYTFEDYDAYVKAQRAVTGRKIAWPNARCFTSPVVMDEIAAHHRQIGSVDFGCCHGVRRGEELEMIEQRLGGLWLGTEIFEELCDNLRIIHWDFSQVRDDWVNKFDVVYSNSLDHSSDPAATLQVWANQLSAKGRLYVEWTPWHDKLGRHGNKADCFAASLEEYEDLMKRVGQIEQVLVVDERKYCRFVFCVKVSTQPD